MAKKMPAERGTPEEQERYFEVRRHYDMSREDLDARIPDWDKKDELFRSWIPDDDSWPYSAMVFDPRVFTALFEKSARLLANKPRGRMIPREGGDTLGAKINSELLNFQWDDAERIDGSPMLGKWAMMDMNARKYGASFALAKWHNEKREINGTNQIWFDGPSFKPWNNRDVLHNPSYSTIKNWIQLREYVTLDELKRVNDSAKGKPIYKNLDVLRDGVSKEDRTGGDQRSVNWASRNLSIRGLQDFLGRDETFKTIEIVTEYRNDRWITFAPRYGVIIRDIANPYQHGQIPVVMLKYYSVDEDLYGLSEIEPVEKLQRAENALISQYLDAVNISLNPIVKVRAAAVQMHTLEFGMGKKWIMNDPATDVVIEQPKVAGVQEFTLTSRFIIGAIAEALGETSAATSNLVPGGSEKTAAEIKSLDVARNVRDNFNQMFLAEAIKDQMMFWFLMNKQYLFDNPNEQQKVVRIVGRDAVEFFQNAGANAYGFTQEAIDTLTSPEMEEVVADPTFDLTTMMSPVFGVETPDGSVPKFNLDESGEGGDLIIEPEDLTGNYDYIPEVRSMELPDPSRIQVLTQAVLAAADPQRVAIRAQQGEMLKLTDLEVDLFEELGLKDADKYYQKLEGGVLSGTVGGGTEAAFGGGAPSGASGFGGMAAGAQAVS